MNEITIGDKIYISAKRAAEITGYARDYVGQLCREGHVDAKMVGRSWYVYEASIRAHRFGEEVVEEPVAVAPVANQAPAALATEAPAAFGGDGTWENPLYTAEKPELLPELTAPQLEDLLPPAEETLTDMQAAWKEWFDQRQTQLQTPEIESPKVIDERNDAHKRQEQRIEAEEEAVVPQVTMPAEDDDEVSIPMHRMEDAPEERFEAPEEVVVPIHTFAPAPVHAPRPAYAPESVAVMTPTLRIARTEPPAPVMSRNDAGPVQQGRIVRERVIPAQKKYPSAATSGVAHSARSHAPIIAALISISLIAIAVAAIGTGYAGRYLKTLPAKNNPVINFLVGTREFRR